MKNIAKFISTIGNPMSFGLFFGIYIQFFERESKPYGTLPVFFTLIIILPIATFIAYNVKKGNFADYDVSDKLKRNSLYKLVLACFIVLFFILIIGKFPIKAILLVASLLLLMLFSSILNKYYKVSMHTSINFLFAFLFYPLNPKLGLLVGIFGFINMWSRVYLRRHKPIEVILGLFLGITIGTIYLSLFKNLVK